MTNQVSTNELDCASTEDKGVWVNTMDSLKKLVGYDYYTSRAVFEHEGHEIVFINDGMIGRVKLYINGDEVTSYWPLASDFSTAVSCHYQGHHYSVKSRLTNFISMAQKITLEVDGDTIESKHDPRLAALSLKQWAHLFGGFVLMGAAVGGVLSVIIF